jgi:hypothetical protein
MAVSRLWPLLYRSYRKVAEAGSPYCPGCGREMRLT